MAKENQKLKSQVQSLARELNKEKAFIEDLQQPLSKTQTELEKNAANNSQQLNAVVVYRCTRVETKDQQYTAAKQ